MPWGLSWPVSLDNLDKTDMPTCLHVKVKMYNLRVVSLGLWWIVLFSEDNSNSVDKLGKIETYVRQCNNLKERKIRPEKL